MEDSNDSNKQKRKISKATSPGALAAVEEELVVEPEVKSSRTTASTTPKITNNKSSIKKKERKKRSITSKPGVIQEYDEETGGTTAGVGTVNAHISSMRKRNVHSGSSKNKRNAFDN